VATSRTGRTQSREGALDRGVRGHGSSARLLVEELLLARGVDIGGQSPSFGGARPPARGRQPEEPRTSGHWSTGAVDFLNQALSLELLQVAIEHARPQPHAALRALKHLLHDGNAMPISIRQCEKNLEPDRGHGRHCILISINLDQDSHRGYFWASIRRMRISPRLAAVSILVLALSVVAVSAFAPQQVPRTGDPLKRGYTDAEFPRVQRLADGVYSYEQLRSAGSEKFTTVSLFVVTSEGVLVADGQGSMEETQRMLGEIAKVTRQPITHIVIGSDHGDHTAGNAAFPSGAKVFAHPTSKAILEGPSGVAPQPITAVQDKTTLTMGGVEIQILFLGRAHTGGDLSVYLPNEKVLFMSEAYLNRIFPAMRSAYPSEWVATIEKAQALDVTTYVPGHGFVESPAVLREELEMARKALLQVIAEAKRLHTAGVPVEEAVKQARFGDLETWTIRSSQAATAIRRVYQELDGKLR